MFGPASSLVIATVRAVARGSKASTRLYILLFVGMTSPGVSSVGDLTPNESFGHGACAR